MHPNVIYWLVGNNLPNNKTIFANSIIGCDLTKNRPTEIYQYSNWIHILFSQSISIRGCNNDVMGSDLKRKETLCSKVNSEQIPPPSRF